METLMAAAAEAEILLASLGLATMLATLALRGVFWMMRGTARRFEFGRTVRAREVVAEGARLGLVPVRIARPVR
jgi:hypothetical protein